jgi:hypothetical protein
MSPMLTGPPGKPGSSSGLRLLHWLAFAVVAAWLVGAVMFIKADGSVSWTAPVMQPPPAGEHNLAHYSFGSTIRASSYYKDVDAQHHPAFLVDGHPAPTLREKWTSAPSDRHPWIEVRWRQPRTLSYVVIKHAGWREDNQLTLRRYVLTCLHQGSQTPLRVEVRNNDRAIAQHTFFCRQARGIHVDWTPNAPDDLARVFEVEAWGE